jgi:hypothetical protein
MGGKLFFRQGSFVIMTQEKFLTRGLLAWRCSKEAGSSSSPGPEWRIRTKVNPANVPNAVKLGK